MRPWRGPGWRGRSWRGAKLRMTNLKNTVLDPHRGEHGPPWRSWPGWPGSWARLLTRTAKPQNSPSPEDEGIPGNGTAGTETAGNGTAGTETAGTETAGTETAGTETAGTENGPGPFDGWTVITGAKREKTGRS